MERGQLRRGPRRGSVLVEFCLTFPLLLLVFSIVVDYGYLFFVNVNLNGAVREGMMKLIFDARYTDTQVRDSMIGSASLANLTASEVTVSTTSSVTVGPTTYKVARIGVRHTHRYLIPLFHTSATSTTMAISMKALVMPGQTY